MLSLLSVSLLSVFTVVSAATNLQPVLSSPSTNGLVSFGPQNLPLPIDIVFGEDVADLKLSALDVVVNGMLGDASGHFVNVSRTSDGGNTFRAMLQISSSQPSTAAVYVIIKEGAAKMSGGAVSLSNMLALLYASTAGTVMANQGSYTGYTNQASLTLLVHFGKQVTFGPSNVQVTPSQGASWDSEPIETKVLSANAGDYSIVVKGLNGEGTIEVAVDGVSSAGKASLSIVRDVTPPTVQVFCNCGTKFVDADGKEANRITTTEFTGFQTFSEDVINYGNRDLQFVTVGLGGAGMTPVKAINAREYSAKISSINTSPDMRKQAGVTGNSLTLKLWVGADAVTDLAGNKGPSATGGNVLIVQADLPLPPDAQTAATDGAAQASQPATSTTTIILIVVLIVVLLLVLVCIAMLIKKSRRQPRYAPIATNPAADFQEYADIAFDRYRDGAGRVTDQAMKDIVVYEQLVAFTVKKGFPRNTSEQAARQLIQQAGRGATADRITRAQWQDWLRAKITKGAEPLAKDVKELRMTFGV